MVAMVRSRHHHRIQMVVGVVALDSKMQTRVQELGVMLVSWWVQRSAPCLVQRSALWLVRLWAYQWAPWWVLQLELCWARCWVHHLVRS